MKFYLPIQVLLIFTALKASCENTLKPSEIYLLAEKSSFELLVDGRLEGTGFIVNKNGFACSVLHAIKAEASIEIRSPTLGRLNANLVGQSRGDDAILLKLPCRDEPYPFISLSQESIYPGNDVYLLGTPIFRHRTFIKGNVAGKKSVFEYYNGNYNEVVHVSALAAKGCSGGPWINDTGKVVGMQAANVTIGNVHQGIASMIPAERLRKLLDKKQVIKMPTLDLAVEAIWEQSPNMIRELPKGTKGLIFRQVKADGIAAQHGIEEWDILLSANNKIFEESSDFIRYIRKENLWNTINMEVMDSKFHSRKTISISPKELK